MADSDLLKVVKSYWAAECSKDLEGVLAHYTEDADFASPTMSLKGRENIRRFYQGIIDAYRSLVVDPVRTVECGDEIAVEFVARMETHEGQKRRAEGCNLFRIRDGRITRLRACFNPGDF